MAQDVTGLDLSRAPHTLADARVLIVDDSPSDRRLLEEALVENGARRVESVGSLSEARRALTANPVDCILLDLGLPDATGLEGVAVMAAAAPHAPVIVVTGRPADEVVYAALAEGADEYLCKDAVNGALLSELVVRAIERRRGVDRHRHHIEAASAVLDSIESATVALDGSGQIVAVNEAWTAVPGGAGSGAAVGIGINYLRVCDMAEGPWSEEAAAVAEGIRAVLQGEASAFSVDYPCPMPAVGERWFSVRVTPMGELGGGAVVTHLDITDLKVAQDQLQHHDVRIHNVLGQASPVLVLFDADGRVVFASESTKELLGFDAAGVPSAEIWARIDRDDAAAARAAFAAVAAVPGRRQRISLRLLDGDGRSRDLDLTVANMLDDPTVEAVAVTGADITDARLHQIARRLETRLLHKLPVAVVVTDQHDNVVYWNDRAATYFGYTREEAVGRPVNELGLDHLDGGARGAVGVSLRTEGHWEGDIDVRRADGSLIPAHVLLDCVADESIDFRGVVAAILDISERRQLEQDLAFQALHDPLTELPNRRLFLDYLERALAHARRAAGRTAVLFVDLDDFKEVNDRLGHRAGDEVLQVIGARLRGTIRPTDVVARLGGDEFVVCFQDLPDADEAIAMVARIAEAIAEPVTLGEHAVSVTASIGAAVWDGKEDVGPDQLIRNADAAMYLAKDKGKARVELFDDGLRQRVLDNRRRTAQLDEAIESGAVRCVFQPQLDMRSGHLVGFEALARWETGDGEQVAPSEFIALAEDSGLIEKLGRSVLADACEALASWRVLPGGGDLKMSVNVSTAQLANPTFATDAAAIVAAHDIPTGMVCLEVTESMLIDPAVADRALRQLKAAGFEIAIDDFGTGYSSLNRLHRFPVDYLKIDKSFVAGMHLAAEDASIVAGVIALAHSIDVKVVAEGIETFAQHRALEKLDCDVGQGFYWSEGLPAPSAAALIGSLPAAPRRRGSRRSVGTRRG